MTTGRQTITNILRTVRHHAQGHVSSYHRVFSQRRWSSWELARLLLAFLLAYVGPTGPVLLAGDDTVAERPGPKVFGKGRHRDGVRSTHSYTAYRWGHKWVVLSVLVKFRSRLGPGPSLCWWPDTAAQNGLRPMGRAIKRLRIWPGSSWHAWCAGFQSDSASWWEIPVMAPARPHGVVANTAVTSRWSASFRARPPYTSLPHRARPAHGDARV
jgi:hypothetical protein